MFFDFKITRAYISLTIDTFSHRIYWYGVLYLVSFLVIRYLIKRNIKKNKLDITNNEINQLSETSMIGGIFGGRVWFLIDRWLAEGTPVTYRPYQVWEGGMTFQGGLMLGFITGLLWVIFKKKTKELPYLSDIITAHLPLGIMIGRIGNLLNEEFMWPVTISTVYINLILLILSIFNIILNLNLNLLFLLFIFVFLGNSFFSFMFHKQWLDFVIPSCLFSSLTEGFLSFLILRTVLKRSYKYKFRTTWLFFVFYGLMRFWNDFYRGEVTYNIFNLNLKLSQYVGGLIILSSTILYSLYYLLQKKKNRVDLKNA